MKGCGWQVTGYGLGVAVAGPTPLAFSRHCLRYKRRLSNCVFDLGPPRSWHGAARLALPKIAVAILIILTDDQAGA